MTYSLMEPEIASYTDLGIGLTLLHVDTLYTTRLKMQEVPTILNQESQSMVLSAQLVGTSLLYNFIRSIGVRRRMRIDCAALLQR